MSEFFIYTPLLTQERGKGVSYDIDMYFVYMLLCEDGSYYTGITNNLEKRFKNHVSGKGARYTKIHKPVKIIYQQEFATKSEALKREWKLKKLTRIQKEELI